MTTFIGVDDTDSTKGMCTTYLLTEIIKELDFPVLFGYPRLVRLNPNIPWKTRGNGALSLSLSGEESNAFKIGEVEGRDVLCSHTPSIRDEGTDRTLEKVSSAVERLAEFEDENTNPGIAVSASRPDAEFYWRTVRGIVGVDEAMDSLSGAGGKARTWKNGRGLIGATASIAWSPCDRTYEIIAYREKSRWGSSRLIDAGDAYSLSSRFPSTFNNYDIFNRHVCIVPSSPCPVLFGIRGSDPDVLEEAMLSIGSEPRDRWLIFESNQGTDDHIAPPGESLEPFHSYTLSGTVSSFPLVIRGGHVFFSMETDHGNVRCASFEETKELRRVSRQLLPGDRVSVWGGLKPSPYGLNLNVEKLAVTALTAKRTKVANPQCPSCGRKMHSAGKVSGYRCRECHTRSDEPVYSLVERQIQPGLYAAASSSRRHLSMPPERIAYMGKGEQRSHEGPGRAAS